MNQRKPIEVAKDIQWVGALDYDIRIFDIIMYTEEGTTYNSYVVQGQQKTAVIELVKETFFDEFLQRLNTVTTVDKIDYVITNHAEPDHSGSLRKLLELNNNITVVGSAATIKFLKKVINMDFKALAVKENDTLSLGDKTFRFISVPFLHWPDTMYSYLQESNTIFTCDSFGCHFCDEKIFNDSVDRDFYDSYKYYYDNIMGPFKPHVLNALEKIKDLKIDIICPGHGPIIRSNPEKYIEYYRQWSTPVPRTGKSVVIPFVSAYGYTKEIAEKIAEGVKSAGVTVHLFDLVYADKAQVMDSINEADGLLVGCPTLVGDALPPIMQLLAELNPIIHSGLKAGAFGSYGWSGEAVPNILERFKQLKFSLPLPGFKVCFRASEDEKKAAFKFGEDFAAAL